MHRKFSRPLSVLLAIFMLATTAAVPGQDNNSGFKTAQPSMLTAVKAGVEITPLLTVGDFLPSGFRFESIPDGISIQTRGQGRVDLL